MKKLMLAMAITSLIGVAQADLTSTGFENDPPYKAGELLSTTNDDTGLVEGEPGFAKVWEPLADNESTIVAYGEGAETKPTAADVGVENLDVGNNYLRVDTGSYLQRCVQYGGGATNIAEGIYLDTLVKFTPAESVLEEIEDGDKIAISYVGQDPTDLEEGEKPISNIVVRAGYVNGSSIVATNYIMNLPNNAVLDLDKWHRLTVRAIADVGYENAPVGFAIYLDGNSEPLTYTNAVAAGDADYIGALSSAIKKNLYNDEKHALLPSLVRGGTAVATLTSVGFKGNGCVDNLSFKDQVEFIDEATAVTIAWDDGVDKYVVAYGETSITNDVSGAGSFLHTIDAGVATITVTAEYVEGREADVWTDAKDDPLAGNQFSVDVGTININSMTPMFDVGGTHYGTFSAALAAAVEAGTSASPATIKLLANYDNAISFSEGFIVLDLNGKTLQGGDADTYTIVNSGATLTIIDSATGGTVEAPIYEDAEGALYTDGGTNTINAGTFESTVYTEKMQYPEAPGDIVVNGGVFYDPDYDPEDSESKFYLADYLGDGVKTTYNAEYFTVGEPLIGTYTVTVTPNANATYSAAYNDGGAAVEFVSDVAAVTVGKTITITASPKSGYEYAEQPTGWTLSEGVITKEISAAAEVEIPAPAAVVIGTYSVTVTPNANATYAAAYNDGGAAVEFVNDVAAVTVGKTITITATPKSGYEYAEQPTGWTLSEGVITIEVSAEATVAIPAPTEKSNYPTYIPATDADAKAKYDTWATTYGADTGSAYEDAFLLNIAPDALDQTLEPASITMEGGKVVISANQTLTAVNGKVYVKVATTLAGLASAEWTEATLNEGKVQVTPGSSDTAGFYKIKVDF